MRKPTLQQVITWAIWTLPVVLIAWIIWRNFAPTGTMHLSCTADRCSGSISSFGPPDADQLTGTTKTGDRYRLFAKNPVELPIHTFKPFQRIKVDVTFSTPEPTASLAIGIKNKPKIPPFTRTAFTRTPLLTELKNNWHTVREGSTVLYQRTNAPQFSSVADFVAHPPALDHIRTLGTTFRDQHKRLNDYAPSTQAHTIDHVLRGSHELLAYIQDESLDINFAFQELNRVAGADDIRVSITAPSGKTIFDTTLADDGIADKTGKAAKEKSLPIALSGLENGTYAIHVKIPEDDGLIRQITTRQTRLMFLDHVFLADTDEYKALGVSTKATTLFARGNKLTARTFHNSGKQKIEVGATKVSLDEVLKTKESRLEGADKNTRIKIPIGDVLLGADQFSFDEHGFFQPNFNQADQLGSNLSDSAWYVLALEPAVAIKDNWMVATAEFSGAEVYRSDKDIYSVLLDSPQLAGRTFAIKRVDITLSKEPYTISKLWSKLTALFSK